MSNRNGSILNVIRGGQTIAHFIGMAQQVAEYILIFGSFGFFITFAFLLYKSLTPAEFWGWVNYAQASLIVDFRERPYDEIYFLNEGTDGFKVAAYKVYGEESLKILYESFNNKLKRSAITSAIVLGLIIIFSIVFIWKKGKLYSTDEHIRGATLVKEDEMKLLIDERIEERKLSPGSLSLGSIRLPHEWEQQNVFMVGGPGSGKTVIYSQFLEDARKQKKRAIVHDRSGTYVEKFFRKGKDIILNPLDMRTAHWSLFDECMYEHEFEMVAETLFPETSKGDPFWYEAPRLVFTYLALKEAAKPNPSAKQLTKKILSCPLDELIKICEGTYAQSVIDKNVIKQSQTLRSIVATKMRCLRLFDDDQQRGFSIRKWVLDSKGDGTIFITSNEEMKAYLRPLITIWLELASIAILSLPEPSKHDLKRIFLFYDELHALGKMKSLGSTLAEIRKYGGSAILGFQGYSQGKRIYDEEGMDELADSCATYIFLRSNNGASAEWITKQLGKYDVYEASESLSYGQERVRDGVNMSVNRNIREVVMPTEIQNLDDLEGFLKVGRQLPVSKFKVQYKARKKVADAFIMNNKKFVTAQDLLINDSKSISTEDTEPGKNELDNEHNVGESVVDDLIDSYSDDVNIGDIGDAISDPDMVVDYEER